MDPGTVAAIGVLAGKLLESGASEAGKDVWNRVKSVLGWTETPTPEALPARLEEAVAANPAVLPQLQAIVGTGGIVINAKNVGAGVVYGGQTVNFND